MKYLYLAATFTIITACGGSVSEDTSDHSLVDDYTPLPHLGFHDAELATDENGQQYWDSIYYQVPDFEFINQDSVQVTNADTDGKVYVANFFFTSCPSICPSMMAHMARLQEKTEDIDELLILSHTIDPERDSLAKLRQYVVEREIDTRNWHLLYNEREYTHYLGKEGYLLTILDSDEEDSGGFLHSEFFVLVDRDRHIRGLYNGTITEEVDKLADDIRDLIENEYK